MIQKKYYPNEFNHKVDGIGFPARHFNGLGKEAAVTKMKENDILKTFDKDEAWAAKAFDEIAAAVKKADTPPAKEKSTSGK